jgi:CDP-4-dehydro-6-deoxyglucose reductase, E3
VPGGVHHARVARISPLADGVVEYALALDAPLAFRPGQFLSLEIGRDADENPILRSYSLASSPGQPEAALVIKVVPGGRGSEWFRALRIGDAVRFTGPMGFFVLDLAPHAGDVVFGATGVGIAPVRPMLEELLARDERGRVLLLWGNRHPRDLFWDAELAALQAKSPRLEVRRFVSRDAPDWRGERGRITPAIVDELARLHAPTFYLVGNGAMIRDVKAALVARGVDRKKQIRNEAFFD